MYRRYDKGFVVSDHADWPALVRTVEETGARRVLVLHASEGAAFIRHLKKIGIDAEAMTRDKPQGNSRQAHKAPIQGELFS